jgi:hypothetical protein
MASQPTHEDVNLILRLYELRRDAKMRAARDWFSNAFKPALSVEEFNSMCPPGSEPNAYFRMVVSYWEMVASFITSGVLNRELFFQSGQELFFVWEKIHEMVPKWRELMKDPAICKNLETVAGQFREWRSQDSPEWYPTFANAVRGQLPEQQRDSSPRPQS